MSAITWGTTAYRPKKADQGHTAIRYGFSEPRPMRTRGHVKCQCGTTYSGWGSDGGSNSHRQHQQREARKTAAQAI